MSVNLSPVFGAAGQLFDDNGNPLSGGKINTYYAGTTTLLATYTTVNGNISHTNPIILDAAGRVPAGGEIWLENGIGYKFVITDANNVLIGTYDNVPSSAQPAAANDADSIFYEQGNTVTAGNFVSGTTYRILTLGNTNFTLIGAAANNIGLHFIATGAGTGTGTAEISQTVQEKLQQYVTPEDFGAIGDATTDDTAAVQAAINYCVSTNPATTLLLPNFYLINSSLTINRPLTTVKDIFVIQGVGGGFYKPAQSSSYIFTAASLANTSEQITFKDVVFRGLNNNMDTGVYVMLGNVFRKIVFNGCTFDQIKAVEGGLELISYQMINCEATNIFGTLFNCSGATGGLNAGVFLNNRMKNSGSNGSFFNAGSAGISNVSFIGNLFQTNFRFIVISGVSDGLTIADNYIEDNTGRAVEVTAAIFGVCITGNSIYSRDPTNADDPNFWELLFTGAVSGIFSGGNFFFKRAYRFTTSTPTGLIGAGDTAVVSVIDTSTGFVPSYMSGNALIGQSSIQGTTFTGTRIVTSGGATINSVAAAINNDYTVELSNTSATTPYVAIFNTPNADSNDATRVFWQCRAQGLVERASLRSNGGLANYSANNVNLASDERLKKDIVPLDTAWEKVKELEVVNFRYKDSNEGDPLLYGVIAQQVQQIVPELVVITQKSKNAIEAKEAVLDEHGNEIEPAVEAKEATPDYFGIREQPMYWLAIKALQEAMKRIETLEAKLLEK